MKLCCVLGGCGGTAHETRPKVEQSNKVARPEARCHFGRARRMLGTFQSRTGYDRRWGQPTTALERAAIPPWLPTQRHRRRTESYVLSSRQHRTQQQNLSPQRPNKVSSRRAPPGKTRSEDSVSTTGTKQSDLGKRDWLPAKAVCACCLTTAVDIPVSLHDDDLDNRKRYRGNSAVLYAVTSSKALRLRTPVHTCSAGCFSLGSDTSV